MNPDFSSTLALRWRNHHLEPVFHPQHVSLQSLVGIDRQKAAVVQNCAQFVAELPFNHMLLTGARGTGKSSLVKALLPEFGDRGLRLIEVAPFDLCDLPDIVAPLRSRSERFVLYVDDFSITDRDPALTALKTALDGGVEAPPNNVMIAATSNRRHLLPEFHSENREYRWQDDELHPGETTEEKISLSERFGLWLSFLPFDQQQYLDAVRLQLLACGHTDWDEALQTSALRWALHRGSRSARVAQQFARDHAGRLQLAAKQSSLAD